MQHNCRRMIVGQPTEPWSTFAVSSLVARQALSTLHPTELKALPTTERDAGEVKAASRPPTRMTSSTSSRLMNKHAFGDELEGRCVA